jgi:hypothetical protein
MAHYDTFSKHLFYSDIITVKIEVIAFIILTPDIADVGFIIGYISPDDVFESCGLGMIGVLEPGPGGPPPGGPPP